MKNLKMFCPVYGIPIQKCVTFARRLGPVFTAILSALALAEKSPGHICTHLPKGVAPPLEVYTGVPQLFMIIFISKNMSNIPIYEMKCSFSEFQVPSFLGLEQ